VENVKPNKRSNPYVNLLDAAGPPLTENTPISAMNKKALMPILVSLRSQNFDLAEC
jgi:hypothetical protein